MKHILTAAGITEDKGITKTRNGPALRYIGALLAAENHNFEEEFLLGENKITTRQYGVDDNNDPCYREKIEFRTNGQENNYYYLDYYEYNLTPDDYDVYIDPNNTNKLIIDLHNKKTSFNSKTKLYQVSKTGDIELVSVKDRSIIIEDLDRIIADNISAIQ